MSEQDQLKRLESVLNTAYICAASNLKDAPMLPCRVDEMTKREHAIYEVAAHFSGTVSFLVEYLRERLQQPERGN
jgi:hypothetical protein